MAREELSRADRDEDARAAVSERLARANRKAELDRREIVKKGQQEALRGSPPPMVRAVE